MVHGCHGVQPVDMVILGQGSGILEIENGKGSRRKGFQN